MDFVRVWLTGYYNPARAMEQLRSSPAPHWGFYGQLLRAAMDALLLYLPLAIMGLVPPTSSYVSALPTEQYYLHLVWLAPLVLAAEWVLGSGFVHLVLRLSGRQSDFDQLLNIGGMVALIVGTFILLWDWVWFSVGGVDQYFLGFTHLAISMWAVVIGAIGMKKILGVPSWLGLLLGLLEIPITLPLAIMFMRSPL
jgi:hypothetical protein